MPNPYTPMLEYKSWANRGLHAVISDTAPRLDDFSRGAVMQLLDHMYAVDDIFHHHLTNCPHAYDCARSPEPMALEDLLPKVAALDDWYVAYSRGLEEKALAEPLEITFTGGTAAKMTRAQILTHIAMHGTYHRGAIGIILQKSGIMPNDDRVTDFLAS